MPVYAIGITPLLPLSKLESPKTKLGESPNNVKHSAFADDISGAGKLNQLLNWWAKY